MGEDGNTTNPTKSPSDPYVFNTVLTRSKSLVVVVGNPVALLNIEHHMVKTYGEKARCWSSFIRLCLEQNSFLVPPEVERDQLKRSEFELRLKAKLFDSDSKVSNMYSHLANLITLKQRQALPSDASATANFLNLSPAKQTFADASRYRTSYPAKSTSKPPQKSAAPAPGQVPKHAQAKQQQQNPPVTARKQPTARPALKQPLQGSSKTAGTVLRQEQPKSLASQQFQQSSPLTVRRVSEQHHSLPAKQSSPSTATRVTEQHDLLPAAKHVPLAESLPQPVASPCKLPPLHDVIEHS